MKKIAILLFASLLFVSCATTKHVTTENSKIFKAYDLQAGRIEIVENKELRDLFDEFNSLYFNDELWVDYIISALLTLFSCTAKENHIIMQVTAFVN